MTDPLTEAQLEAELLKLSRSRASGTLTQARVKSAHRSVLQARRRERLAEEKAERERLRQQEHEVQLVWPSPTPDEPVPDCPGYWPHETQELWDSNPSAALHLWSLGDGRGASFQNEGQCVAFVVKQARQTCLAERARIGLVAFRNKYGLGPYHVRAMRRCVNQAAGQE